MKACRTKYSPECTVQAVAARTAMVISKGPGGWGQAADPVGRMECEVLYVAAPDFPDTLNGNMCSGERNGFKEELHG